MSEHDQMVREIDRAWAEIAALTAERDRLRAALGEALFVLQSERTGDCEARGMALDALSDALKAKP